jgi:hypothetical protein
MKMSSPQSELSAIVDATYQKNLLSRCSEEEKARILACSAPGSGAWLTVAPIEALDFKMTPKEFSTALRYRLGVTVQVEGDKCPKCKTATLDKGGKHSVNCSSSGDRIQRHDAVRNSIAAFCRVAMLSPQVEHGAGPGRERPDDIFIPFWHAGKAAAVDVSFTNPLNQGIRSKAAMEVGAAATERETFKMKKYEEFSITNNITVIPFSIETFGGLGKVAQCFLDRLATFVAQNKGSTSKVERRYMAQRISFISQRRNARMIIDRCIN